MSELYTPALLVSYVFVKEFLKHRNVGSYRRWVLDSGAYSALTSGVKIELSKFIDDSAKLLQTDHTLHRVFALDVIGDPEATARNAEEMNRQGIPAVPTFHYGSPLHYLKHLAKTYDRLALGGLAQRGSGGHGTKLMLSQRMKFINDCLKISGPRWVHAFGCADARLVMKFPLSSVDASTWAYSIGRYGMVPGLKVSIGKKANNKAIKQNALFCAIDHYGKTETKHRGIWGNVQRKVGVDQLDICLACGSAADIKMINAFHQRQHENNSSTFGRA